MSNHSASIQATAAPEPSPPSPSSPSAPWPFGVGMASIVGIGAAMMAVVSVWLVPQVHRTSWHFFDQASRLLFSHRPASAGGGLAVYAVHPEFQFGPLSIVGAQVLRMATFGHASLGAAVVMGAMVPVVLWLALDSSRAVTGRDSWSIGTIGAVVALVIPWTFLSIYTRHLDDALAITLALAAVWGVATGRDVVTGIGLGLAVASKPWALAFLPLVLALPPQRRRRAGALALGIGVIAWLPFVLGASGTVSALGHFTIRNGPNSALRALGVHDAVTPSWDRSAQLVVGVAVATWCALRGRWPAVLMVAVAVRLALDPGVHRYYVAGIVAFVLAWELITDRWRVPLVTMATTALLLVPRYLVLPSTVRGDLRLATCLALVVLGCVVSARPSPAEPLDAHASAEIGTGADRPARGAELQRAPQV